MGSTRQHQGDAQPRQSVDHQGRDKRKARNAQSQVFPHSIHQNGDHGHAADQAGNHARRAQRGSRPRQRLPPRGCARRVQDPAQRPASRHHPEQAEQYREPSCEPGLVKSLADFRPEATVYTCSPAGCASIDEARGEPCDADHQEQQWHEKQEQAERDRAAQDSSSRFPISPVDAGDDIDDGNVFVPRQPLPDWTQARLGRFSQPPERSEVTVGFTGPLIIGVVSHPARIGHLAPSRISRSPRLS